MVFAVHHSVIEYCCVPLSGLVRGGGDAVGIGAWEAVAQAAGRRLEPDPRTNPTGRAWQGAEPDQNMMNKC